MPRRPVQSRPVVLAAALFFASLLSCGREITGPDGRGGRAGSVQLDPRFATVRLGGTGEVLSIGSVVEFDRVRVVLRRSDGTIAVDTLVPFPADVESISLRLSVTLDPQAPSTGETLSATMKYVNATGDTVFSGGPVSVVAKPGTSGTPAPVPIEIGYVGPGANAKSILITPGGYAGYRLATTSFLATVLDSSDAPLPLAPVAFTSTDSQRVRVDLRTGEASLLGARGGARIIAQTLTGQADTAQVDIIPVATSVIVVSGAGQQTRQGEAFANPVRVRALAVDNLGVEGVVIAFDVLQGQGTVSQARDTTDANGDAEVTWTAGDSAGTAILRASIFETVTGININGTQLSSAASNLTISPQPTNIVAGGAITDLAVVVRDVLGDTVTAFNGDVTLALSGGTVGANLVGATTVQAVAGVALFSELTVDRAGAGYRLVATLPALPGVPAVQTNTFNVTAAPPANLFVAGGAGQSAPASTALADSIKVRVTDTFGYGVPAVAVNFTVSGGGGSVSPAIVNTDANGYAATRWTLGAAGVQQVTASVTGLTPVNVSATIPAVGGDPVLFLGLDAVSVPLGRSRQVPVFLTNPTPSDLTVTLTVRDSTASWSVGSVVILAGGNQSYPTLAGDFVGQTWAIASSSAGTDSVLVTVDSLVAVIDGPSIRDLQYTDTLRTVVRLPEPAPAGGLLVTVRSTDSSAVLVAPGTGLGQGEELCYYCNYLRAAPTAQGALLAPPSGTATILIPEGELTGHLVVVAIGQPAVGSDVPLLLEAPDHVGVGVSIRPREPFFEFYIYFPELAPGLRGYGDVYSQYFSPTEQTIRLRSLDPGIVTVDSLIVIPRQDYYSTLAFYRAIAPGIGRLVAEYPGGAADTVQVSVLPGRVQAIIAGNSTVPVGTRTQVQVNVGADFEGFYVSGGDADTSFVVTVTSRSPGVVQALRGSLRVNDWDNYAVGDFLAVGSGTAWIVAEAPGFAPDSVLFTTAGEAISIAGNINRLGVGLREDAFYVQRTTSGILDAPMTVTLSSDDPSVLAVLTPEVSIRAGWNYAYARLEGRSAGTVTLTATAAGATPVTQTFQVLPTVANLSTFLSPSTYFADSAYLGVSTNLTDGLYSRPASDTIRLVLRSTNPAAVLVTDSIVVFSPGNSSGLGAAVRAIAPGTAQLTLSGYTGPVVAPDTSAVITVIPPRLNIPQSSVSVGRTLQTTATVFRTTPTTVALPYSVTVQGPAGVTIAGPNDAFAIGESARNLLVRSGNTLGTDTVIVTAAGSSPDTLYVSVVGTRVGVILGLSQLEVGREASLWASLRNASGTTQQSRDTAQLRIVSRDTAVLQVLNDSPLLFPGNTASQTATLRAIAPGGTWLVAEHLNGTSTSDSVYVLAVPPQLYVSDYSELVMGMEEITYYGQYYVQRSTPSTAELWVRLTSSSPQTVSVPDSVLIASGDYYAYFQITSGDTTGSAVVSISADGYAGATLPVFVTRSTFDAYAYDVAPSGGRTQLEIWRENANYDSYQTLVDIPIQLTVADTGIAKAIPDTLTMRPSDFYYVEANGITGVRSGYTVITVSDRRAASFQRTLPGSADLYVSSARLYSTLQSYTYLPPGTSTTGSDYLYLDGAADSIWVQLRSVGGRFTTSEDSLLLQDYYSAYFALTGVTAGLDTLVMSAPGFAPETLLVRLGQGVLNLQGVPPTNIRQGDSVQVFLGLQSASGQTVVAGPAGLDLSLSTTSALQTTLGAGPISTVPVTSGSTSVTFWVKALAPGGGTLTVSHPSFATFTLNIGTRSP